MPESHTGPQDEQMTALGDVTRALERLRHLRLAVVFGSCTTGHARPDSDIYLGILLDPGADVTPALRVDLERHCGKAVDLVRLDTAPPLLRFEIARSGRLLLQRAPHAWSEFRARAMIDWWDWAPTARMMHRTLRVRLREEAGRGPS